MDFKLDYTYVRNVVKLLAEMPRVPSEEERRAFKFQPERYNDAVVIPWYRDKEHPSFYFVAEVFLRCHNTLMISCTRAFFFQVMLIVYDARACTVSF